MGNLHAQVYAALPQARIAAVVDEDVARVQNRVRELRLDVPVYRSLQDALRIEQVDVVDVCLPTPLHPPHVRTALAAGKNVFCEKPFAATVAEARALAAAARRAGLKMQVGHCIRFWPEYQALERYVREQRGGRLLSLTLFRRSGRPIYSIDNWINNAALSGGGAFDLHIHDTDFVQHLLGTPTAVTSSGTQDCGGWSHLFTTYHFKDVAVTAEGGWNYPPQWGFQMGFEAVFEHAVIEYDSRANPTLMLTEREGPRQPLSFEAPAIGETNGYGGNISALGGYFNELRYFIDCLEDDRAPKIATPDQAAESVRIVRAEIKSATLGRRVQL